jgi:hypothetical protein
VMGRQTPLQEDGPRQEQDCHKAEDAGNPAVAHPLHGTA